MKQEELVKHFNGSAVSPKNWARLSIKNIFFWYFTFQSFVRYLVPWFIFKFIYLLASSSNEANDKRRCESSNYKLDFSIKCTSGVIEETHV